MEEEQQRTPVGIRIDRELLHQARIAAVSEHKTLGMWLEEAIVHKIENVPVRGRPRRKRRYVKRDMDYWNSFATLQEADTDAEEESVITRRKVRVKSLLGRLRREDEK